MIKRAHLLVLPLLAAAALGACSSDGEQVADQIAEKVGDVLEIDAPATTCPDDAEAGDGNTFDCDVTVEDQDLVASVTFTSDDEFTFEFDSDVFATGDLEGQLGEQAADVLGVDVTFDCPGDENTVIPFEGSIECPGEAEDGTTGRGVIELDESGVPQLVDLVQD
jgi:hypothetical protein